jgi:hypothetical protein
MSSSYFISLVWFLETQQLHDQRLDFLEQYICDHAIRSTLQRTDARITPARLIDFLEPGGPPRFVLWNDPPKAEIKPY